MDGTSNHRLITWATNKVPPDEQTLLKHNLNFNGLVSSNAKAN